MKKGSLPARFPIIVATVIFVIVIAGGYWYSRPKDVYIAAHPVLQDILAATSTVSQAENDVDTDDDGLKDWEEVLWKTSPTNPDTDGDGVSDAVEVTEGRDPLEKGVGTGANPIAGQGVPEATEEVQTATERVAKDLFAKILVAKKNGETLSSEDAAKYVKTLLPDETAEVPTEYSGYALTDLHLIQRPTAQDIRAYGNALGKIIFAQKDAFSRDELLVLEHALKNSKPDELTHLAPTVAGYRALGTQAFKIAVPQDVSLIHLEFVKSSLALSGHVKSLQAIFTDPVVGAGALAVYNRDRERFEQTISDLVDYFEQSGVIFNSSEYGYTFRTGI